MSSRLLNLYRALQQINDLDEQWYILREIIKLRGSNKRFLNVLARNPHKERSALANRMVYSKLEEYNWFVD